MTPSLTSINVHYDAEGLLVLVGPSAIDPRALRQRMTDLLGLEV